MFRGTLASESIGKKFLVLITGYKMNVCKVKEKWHIFPMEDIDDRYVDLKRKLVIVPRDEGRDKIVERLSKAAEDRKNRQLRLGNAWVAYVDFCYFRFDCCFSLRDFVWLLVRFVLGG